MKRERLVYIARRLRTVRAGEPVRRMRAWLRHRKEERLFERDPDAWSAERLFSNRDQWCASTGRGDLVRAVDAQLLNALPDGWWQDKRFWDTFSALYPAQTQELLDRARSVLSGRFRLFQWRDVDLSAPIKWSATMEEGGDGEEWQRLHYSRLNVFHDPARPQRDVKWCWELNRCRHLLYLGAAWRISRDETFARGARDLLESWMDDVLYPLGVQWRNNLEVAIRAITWMRTHILCMGSESWNSEFMNRFVSLMCLHGHHVEKELSIYRSENNHLVGEASALAQLGLHYPLFRDSSRWCTRSTAILNWLVPRLILPDGVYSEQATGYVRFVAELLFPLILQRQHANLSPTVLERMTAALQFIQALRRDHRDVPMIGDSDTGLAIGWELSDFWDFSVILSSGSVLLAEPHLADNVDEFPAESFLLLGQPGLDAFMNSKANTREREPERPPTIVRSFPYGGYRISRDNRFEVVFDCGPLGLSPGFEHGHADGLSFLLTYNSQSALVDSGTGLYNGWSLWRNYFRSTGAHNTMRIDGEDATKPVGTFRWSRPLEISGHPPIEHEGWVIFRASIKWGRILHHRFIAHIWSQCVLVMDYVQGSGEHYLERWLHLDPRWRVQEISRGLFSAVCGPDRLDVLLFPHDLASPSVLCGSMDPLGGWYSRYYGHWVPTPTLRSLVSARLPAGLVTVIKPVGEPLILPVGFWKAQLPGEILDIFRSQELAALTGLES